MELENGQRSTTITPNEQNINEKVSTPQQDSNLRVDKSPQSEPAPKIIEPTLNKKEEEIPPVSELEQLTAEEERANSENVESPKVESLAAAVSSIPSSSRPTAEIGSRFYIKRRIVVGNVSKFIAPGKFFFYCYFTLSMS